MICYAWLVMQSIGDVLIPIAIVTAALLVGIVILVAVLRSAAKRSRARLEQALGGSTVLVEDSMANFFGLQSRGVVQGRGNGALVLTSDALGFMLMLGKQPLLIRRSTIQKIDTVRSHLGKTIGRSLLAVHFTNDAGEADLAVWYVRDLRRWLDALGRIP